MLKTTIVGGTGKGRKTMVDDQYALVVSMAACPPLIPQKNRVFRQPFTTDGTAAGTSSMVANGASTNIPYYIPAHPDNDRYITRVSFITAYGGASTLIKWCDGTALTNGFRFFYTRRSGEYVDIHSAIKSNMHLLRLGVAEVLSAWEVPKMMASNDYGIIVGLDLVDLLPPYGLKLDAASEQRLTFTVRDDNTAATSGCDMMDVIAYGFERMP